MNLKPNVMNKSMIACPECGNHIDVNEILKHQLQEEFKSKLENIKSRLIMDQDSKIKSIIDAKKLDFKKEIEKENEDRINEMEQELSQKSEKLKSLNKKEGEILRLKRDFNLLKEQSDIEAKKKVNEALESEYDRLSNLANSKSQMKIKELEKKLEDQIDLTQQMKRKQEQGSMQLQGEVMELAIEEWLKNKFPLDLIQEVKKGAQGADCLQIINTRGSENCGSIYYESKRTKSFQPAWIEKFKNDIRDKKANIGVLVTEAMPSGMKRMGMVDGVYVCSFEEFKSLSYVLRESIIQLSRAMTSNENKGDKMQLLYEYLTSIEFKLQIEGIVEGFTTMQHDLIKEKNSMNRIWKQREKQIDKVVKNTIDMYGSIKGIAGNSVPSVELLENSYE